MTTQTIEERRQFPRYPVLDSEHAIMPFSLSVQLLDISQTGVMLQSAQQAKEGSRGHLRFDLAGQPFSVDVEVRRVARPAGTNYRIGARFVALSEEQRQIIEAFTRR